MSEQSLVLYSAENSGNRSCGGCTLCCKLVPVAEIGKKGGVRCQYQKHTGCSIYHQPAMPHSCQIWSCRWLIDPEARDLRRPDRSRYVIDPIPDFVTVETPQPDGSVSKENVPVVQVWCDPQYADAHRDPALRAYLEAMNAMALIRYNSEDGIVIIPPGRSSTHQWHEQDATNGKREHSKVEVAEVLRSKGYDAVAVKF